MKKILTGLQPTGEITLGNYIGSIKQMVKLQDEYESYIFIADLHSITIPQNPKELRKNIKNLLALYIACGINPDKNIVYIQSENEYHTNISWLLECNTYFGELSRMTQFKDKSRKNANFSAGLFTYPILMAADILAYDIDLVPIGIDQKQHVELARDIAERFNKKYGETFKIPEPYIDNIGTKIMDLQDPIHKMSKSSENDKGIIRMLDDPEIIRKKIMSAVTDSETKIKFDKENKPGISNLINIYSSLSGKNISDVEEEFKNSSYGEFKKAVADTTVAEITKIQQKYNQLIESDKLDKILDNGINITKKIAKEKYELMKAKIGLGRECKKD
ncbi:MAG: tryptophan--tRNA ligase [Bacilli bacterium]|nr:tryptophan--tRNA ligase [Bacilli bacterium]